MSTLPTAKPSVPMASPSDAAPASERQESWWIADAFDFDTVLVPSASDAFSETDSGSSAVHNGTESLMYEGTNCLPAGRHSYADIKWKKFWGTLRAFFVFVGPGWIVSMAYLDPGNLEGDLAVGAIRTSPHAGYSLLWLLLQAHVMGWALQVLAIRLGNSTGLDLAALCRLEYPRPVSLTIWFFIECAIISADFQAVIGTAIALSLLLGLPIWLGIVITLIDTFSFLIIQFIGVRKMEALFGLLMLIMAVCFGTNLIISKPDAGAIFRGMFVPGIPPSSYLEALGLLGCIIMPHNSFLHSALVRTRAVKRDSYSDVKRANKFFAMETGGALILSFVINVCVVGSFANPRINPSSDEAVSLYTAHLYLESAFGVAAKYIWAVGLLAAGQNSTMAGTLAGQYVMQSMFDFKVNPVLRILIVRSMTIIPLLAFTLIFQSSVDEISQWINILQSILLPVAIFPLLKFNFSHKAVGGFAIEGVLKIFYILIVWFVIVGNFVSVLLTLINLNLSIGYWVLFSLVVILYLGGLLYLALKKSSNHYCCHADSEIVAPFRELVDCE